jgi:hypothetical protein
MCSFKSNAKITEGRNYHEINRLRTVLYLQEHVINIGGQEMRKPEIPIDVQLFAKVFGRFHPLYRPRRPLGREEV